jgi:putative ABC transport system permease protein
MFDKNPSNSFYILVKAQDGVQSNIMKKINDIFNLAMPYKDAVIKSMKDEQTARYSAEKGFRNAMLAGNVIILLITAMGLMGYIVTEVTRRQKELAIRKISGAKLSDILRVFIIELESVALPAVLTGLIGAWFIAGKWMENFASKIHLHWGIFTLCSITILIMIAFIAAVNYISIANRNPIESLKNE